MKIRIYQIDSEKDVNNVSFVGFERLEKYQGSGNVDSEIYNKVYVGDVDCSSLEGVYSLFNTNRPPEFTGHSLSVSDVVEVIDSPKIVGMIERSEGFKVPYTDFLEYSQDIEDLRSSDIDFTAHDYIGLDKPIVERGFYFCDNIGFKKVEFEPEKALAKEEEKIKVVMVEPGKEARIVELCGELRAMQHAVQGYIEVMYPFEDEVAIVCNEEGKIDRLPLNRAIYMDGEMVDIIAGNFFIADTRGENFGSLSDDMADKYLKMFKEPERFYRALDGSIKAEKIRSSLKDVISEAQKNSEKSTNARENRSFDRDM